MLSQEEKINFLRMTEFFKTVEEDHLTQFVRLMDEVRYTPNDVVLRKGEQGDAMFFIVAGTVSVLKQGIRALDLGAGDCIGEMALLDNDPRSATIVAVTPVVTLRRRRDDFDELLNSTPVMKGMYRILVQKIRTDLETYVESVRAQEQVKQDLRRAREIQEAMLPQSDLSVGSIYITGVCRPADSIGGDYYDHMVLDENRIGVFIGDAAGHGFHSGLIGAMIKSGLFTQIEVNADVLAVMSTVNRIVHRHGPDWSFFTACFIIFDLSKKTLRYSNAGH
ncbi:MAG: cyclic nucleotide-binding domain-containing protein, partial [candidate division Zixibacteria bacterium]|nr:cyclic nucleotide-binding domain-containing protein [candidate division Zixibacteria bacterium]